MSPGEVWLDDKNSQTVRVETIQVGQRSEIKFFDKNNCRRAQRPDFAA